jgi:hypothetical protein
MGPIGAGVDVDFTAVLASTCSSFPFAPSRRSFVAGAVAVAAVDVVVVTAAGPGGPSVGSPADALDGALVAPRSANPNTTVTDHPTFFAFIRVRPLIAQRPV